MKAFHLVVTLALGALAASGQDADDHATFQAAQTLQREGKDRDAFLTFLSLPGGEHAAVTLARPQAKEFLEFLRRQPGSQLAPRAKLVEADLVLALGRKQEARQLYHKLATDGPAGNWGTERADYYPVEPPRNGDDLDSSFSSSQLLLPFALGPGSHRDNWLLRRLLALDLDEDAAAEFARVWRIHCTNTQPYVAVTPSYDERGNAVSQKKHVIRPAGFSGRGLQFALDYAFFLKRRVDTNAAFDVLLEPLRFLDLDRNPNIERFAEEIPHASQHSFPERQTTGYSVRFSYGMGGSAGVSRKEFLRLCYGEFKAHRREDVLYAAVQKQIDSGTNRARRVLARLRSLDGQLDAALALELDYVARGGFDEASAEWRRSRIYEDYQKNAEAVACLEKFLTLKAGKLDMPDADEQEIRSYALLQFGLPGQFDNASGATPQQIEALTRLQRLYSALGQTDKALDATLREFELNDSSLSSNEVVDQAAQRFKNAEQEQRFTDWAKQRLRDTKNPQVRASLAWHLHDYTTVIEAVAQNADTLNPYGLQPWKERFAKLGTDLHRALLKAVVAANPKDSISRLELLDLDANLDGADAIAALELLLDTDANTAFPRGKGAPRNRTRFRTYLDLAYRLARLYERNHQFDKLHALALRIARGEKPFDNYDQNLYYARDTNDLEEHGNAALALAIQNADDPKRQEQLREALKPARWFGARAQLERRLAATKPVPDKEPQLVRWFHVPTNVTLLASAENVLSLARDEQFVYSGQPWGVSVYDFSGAPVARIALGEAVLAVAPGEHELWAGTPKGLFRVTRTNSQWTVAHRWLHDDLATRDRSARSFPGGGDSSYDNCVLTLALDGELLWIGLRRNIQVLNTRTLELRVFSATELKIERLGEFNRIVPDGEYVWANGYDGLRRYDRASGAWEAPERVGSREPVRLIDVFDGRIFGQVYLNDTLRHRPAFIDRHTLQVSPIQLETGRRPDEQMINVGIHCFGKLDGQIVFGGDPVETDFGAFNYALNTASGKLRPLFAAGEKFSERLRNVRQGKDGDPRLRRGREANGIYDEFAKMFGRPAAPGWHFVTLPDGTRVFGSTANRVRYQYPQEDGRDDTWDDGSDTRGGLFFVSRDGRVRRVSSALEPHNLRGDLTLSVLFDDAAKRDWLCTSVGLARLDSDGRVREQFSRVDGLCANNVSSGAKADGKFYFASGWGWSGGGLIVFDPRTSVFTSWHRTDGLDADKLERVEADGGRLKLTFGVERYHSGDLEYQQAPPGSFDPASGLFTSGGATASLKSEEVSRARNRNSSREPLPFLGGWVTEKFEHDGASYICGTRGLVIARGSVEPPNFASLDVRLVNDPAKDLLAEAKRVVVPSPIPLDRLRELLGHTNGFLRARALAAAMDPMARQQAGYAGLVGGAITDSVMRVRATAVWLLSRSDDDAGLAPLRSALGDSDRYIRAVAALALARRGERPALGTFEEMLAQPHGFGNFPFGADTFIGVEVDKRRGYSALAPQADREAFRLFMKYPLEVNDSTVQKTFEELGAALRRQPDIADELLPAWQEERWAMGQVQFAERVFRHSGKELLPVLHRALTNDDRVIRSNAARGCGAIGDASSTPHLLKALDLESGLSRASIVWALGELKAADALPKLIDLYTDVRNDEQRRAGAGFRYSQAAVMAAAQFDSLRSLDAIAGDWDELKAAATPKKPDPRLNEELLGSHHILEAVRKIGPAAAQAFYRGLAGANGMEERNEAAVALADCNPDERATNLVILRNLLADSLAPVRTRASVSLLLLGQSDVEPLVRERLASADNSERGEILAQLTRLSAPQLEFVRKEVETIVADSNAPQYLHDGAAQLLPKLKPQN